MNIQLKSRVFFIVLLSLLVGCGPSAATETATPTPTTKPPPLTATFTPDPQKLIETATLYSTDFENGYPPELFDWLWYLASDNDSNSILCSEPSDDWSGFLFGLDAWEDYAVSLRMKFLSANENQAAEIFIRVNKSAEGYRASIWNNEWASVGYYPTPLGNNGSSVTIKQDEWFQVHLYFVGDNLKYLINGEIVTEVNDDRRTSGHTGIGAGPNTEVCVDDILVWGLDEDGDPLENPADLVFKPYDETIYSINDKIENRPTIPVFYPWSDDCGHLSEFNFDCDTEDTPYSLLWIGQGVSRLIESTEHKVLPAQSILMQSDEDTIYLISEQWHYWIRDWRTLSPDSKFYLDEVFGSHVDSEYDLTWVINFEHPEWPDNLAEKALNYKNAGFDGMMFDWWHNNAGNGRSKARVEIARMAISKAIREKVGDDFILMGNVNWNVDDSTAQFLSGVFLELSKLPDRGYPLTYNEEASAGWTISFERIEDVIEYWDENLLWPKIIAVEPMKITTGDYIEDRYTEDNYQYAKLFTAMAVVIPENGYILYADNNDDWDGGDHQHAYYDFYHTDFGKANSGMIQVVEGVAYKQFEKGIIAYNRTVNEVEVTLPDGMKFIIGPLEGLFIELP